MTPGNRRTLFVAALLVVVFAVATVIGMAVASRATARARMITPLPATMTLGERYPVVVMVTLPWGTNPMELTPSVPAPLVCAETRSSRSGFGWGVTHWRVSYHLASLALGEHSQLHLRIPLGDGPQAVMTLGDFTVDGILGEGERPTPRLSGLPEQVEAEPRWPLIGTVGIALAIIAIVLFKYLGTSASVVDIPAGDFAREEIERIEGSVDPESRLFDETLSDVLRDYLTMAWDLPVSTQTSRECLETMASALPTDVWERLKEFLEISDKAKYAPATDRHSAASHLDAAKRLVAASEAALGGVEDA